MSAYNGEKYIQEQIDSILAQENVQVKLLIRDDGSVDNTLDIIKQIAANHNNVEFIEGENIWYKRSFYNTLTGSSNIYDYYAFSDQDDVWDKSKLIRAVEMLENESSDIKMYASALRVVDQNLNFTEINKYDKLRISYGSAMSRQRIAGCTMVFSKELFLLCKLFNMNEETQKYFSHDGAVYLICLACGGKVIFDKESFINYRRHSETVTSRGKGLFKRISSVTDIYTKYKRLREARVRELKRIYYDMMNDDVADLS